MNRRTLLWSGVGCVTAAVLLGVVIVLGTGVQPGFDTWWNDALAAGRTGGLLAFAFALDTIGGGWVAVLLVPLLAIAALLLARRWRSAVFAALCFAASAALVQLLKNLFGRARPDDMLVASDFGSFPSGHVANAATIALVVWVLFPRMWTAIVGALWIVAMALSRTVLSVHWASDTLGGALVGVGAVLLLAAWLLPWTLRDREPRASIG